MLPATPNGHGQNGVEEAQLPFRNMAGKSTSNNNAIQTQTPNGVAPTTNGVTSTNMNGAAFISMDGATSALINGTELLSSNITNQPLTNDTEICLVNVMNLKTNGINETNSTDSSHTQLLVFSARDEAALKRVHQQFSKYYDGSIFRSPESLNKLAYNLAERRNTMTIRSFTIADADLASARIDLPNLKCVRSSAMTQLCFVFTGQGAQYSGMGLELIQYPVFKSTLIKANNAFQELGAEWSLFGMISCFLTLYIL